MPPPSISAGACIRRKGSVIDAVLDGEAILLNLDQDAVFGLGTVGSRVWELIDPQADFASLCAALVREFEVEPEQCQREATNFLVELHKLGLIDVTP